MENSLENQRAPSTLENILFKLQEKYLRRLSASYQKHPANYKRESRKWPAQLRQEYLSLVSTILSPERSVLVVGKLTYQNNKEEPISVINQPSLITQVELNEEDPLKIDLTITPISTSATFRATWPDDVSLADLEA